MKAKTWLCPALILLCAVNFVYTTQSGSYGVYPLDSLNSQMLQNDYLLEKRNKPSLSIVNPLDVLRQRLLLEIARRQMKENSRQVELNRAILKNVGKRMGSQYSSPLTTALYDLRAVQQQQQQDPTEHLQSYEYELLPTTLIFDYLQQQEQTQQQQPQQQQQQQQQRPWLSYDSSAIPFVNNYINEDIVESALSNNLGNEAEIGEENAEPDVTAFNGFMDKTNKHSFKHARQSNNKHSSNKANEQHEASTLQKSLNHNHQVQRNKNDLNLNLNEEDPVSAKPFANDYKNARQINANDGDYQLQRYLYHLHKNQHHLTRK